MADKKTIDIEIINERGLHARAAANFVKAIDGLDAEVEVERLGQTVDGNSIMGLMMLAASKGTSIKITASGTEADLAIKNLTNLINSKFGEEK
ncbi:MAG: HPr family phosphocarrier protein [Alphaproteobacteria bacterium]|nr:HPr family phosphocarrier protein [Alphaproteobacteria bacterium]